MAAEREEDQDLDVQSSDESSTDDDLSDTDGEESDLEGDADGDEYGVGGVKGFVQALYRNTIGIFADPLNLYSDDHDHDQLIKRRQINRNKVKHYWNIGGSWVWGASVTMVVIVFPILVVAQRDSMIKEQRMEMMQRQKQAAAMMNVRGGGGGGGMGMPM